MRIICSVGVLNRALTTLNIANGKAVRSSLTIGQNGNEVYLVLQTNSNGTAKKYKIRNNIENVFTKFLNEGKATIRFKVPEHDLAIKCDVVQLKAFLQTLRLCVDGRPSAQLSSLQPSNLPTKAIKPVSKKLKITRKEEYPVLEGFPRTLEYLLINNCNQRTLDSRILRLRNLTVLDLENNELTRLPEQLGSSLPNLAELCLAHNSLGLRRDWRWVVNRRLQTHLRLLDLRSNKIDFLPDKLVDLWGLVTLNLDKNSLRRLPNGIGSMQHLRYLTVSQNRIQYLPGSFKLLRLHTLDISTNAFCQETHKKLTSAHFQAVPPLVNLAALQVIKNRLPFWDLPQTLIDHLQNASFCHCGSPCFSTQPESYIEYKDIFEVSRPNTLIGCSFSGVPMMAVRYCSFPCYRKQNA